MENGDRSSRGAATNTPTSLGNAARTAPYADTASSLRAHPGAAAHLDVDGRTNAAAPHTTSAGARSRNAGAEGSSPASPSDQVHQALTWMMRHPNWHPEDAGTFALPWPPGRATGSPEWTAAARRIVTTPLPPETSRASLCCRVLLQHHKGTVTAVLQAGGPEEFVPVLYARVTSGGVFRAPYVTFSLDPGDLDKPRRRRGPGYVGKLRGDDGLRTYTLYDHGDRPGSAHPRQELLAVHVEEDSTEHSTLTRSILDVSSVEELEEAAHLASSVQPTILGAMCPTEAVVVESLRPTALAVGGEGSGDGEDSPASDVPLFVGRSRSALSSGGTRVGSASSVSSQPEGAGAGASSVELKPLTQPQPRQQEPTRRPPLRESQSARVLPSSSRAGLELPAEPATATQHRPARPYLGDVSVGIPAVREDNVDRALLAATWQPVAKNGEDSLGAALGHCRQKGSMNVYSSRTLQCFRCMPVGHAYLFAAVFPGVTGPVGADSPPNVGDCGLPSHVWDRMRSATAAGNRMVPSEENFALTVAQPTSRSLQAGFAAHCEGWPFSPNEMILRLDRTSKTTFDLEFRCPLSPLQAFAMALARMHALAAERDEKGWVENEAMEGMVRLEGVVAGVHRRHPPRNYRTASFGQRMWSSLRSFALSED